MAMEFCLRGLVAAAFTPMTREGGLALDRVPALVDHLLAQGITAIYVCGSTGEGPSLTHDERRSTAAAYVSAAAGRLPVIVQVGHTSLAEARSLAEHAQQIGADAVSAVAPYYFRPESVDNLVDCLAEITSAAPNLPFYYYHIPALTNVQLDLIQLLDVAGRRLPTFCGIKYTDALIDQLQSLLEFEGGRYDVPFGRDEMLLAGVTAGARGAIGTTYNFAAPIFHRVLAAVERGDLQEAGLWQSRAARLIHLVLRGFGHPALKAIMALIGHDCGPSRLPRVTPTETQVEQLRQELTTLGFFDWIGS